MVPLMIIPWKTHQFPVFHLKWNRMYESAVAVLPETLLKELLVMTFPILMLIVVMPDWQWWLWHLIRVCQGWSNRIRKDKQILVYVGYPVLSDLMNGCEILFDFNHYIHYWKSFATVKMKDYSCFIQIWFLLKLHWVKIAR